MGLLKKIFKPVSKVLDKIIPNELKPILPYAAAFAPYAMPGIMGIGGNTMLSRALMSGGLNIGAQLAQEGSEGDINLLSAGLGALQGAMTAPGSQIRTMHPTEGVITSGQPGAAGILEAKAAGMQPGMMKTGLEALGKGSEFLTDAAKTLQTNPFSVEGLKAAAIPFAQGTADVMYAEGQRDLRDLANDVVDDMGEGYTDDAYRAAIRKSMTAYGATEEEIIDAIEAAGYKSGGRVGMISGGGVKAAWNAMKAAKNKVVQSLGRMTDDVEIKINYDYADDTGGSMDAMISPKSNKGKEVLDSLVEEGLVEVDGGIYYVKEFEDTMLGLKEGNIKASGAKLGSDDFTSTSKFEKGPYESIEEMMIRDLGKKASGGRVALEFGGIGAAVEKVEDKEMKETMKLAQDMDMPIADLVEEFIIIHKRKPNSLEELKMFYKDKYEYKGPGDVKMQETMTERFTAKDGGTPSVLPKGIEADYRGGGFIPIGSRERADDVPARLSENEFVMTADAVRAAGGGSVNRGAKRMYDLMHNLEARA